MNISASSLLNDRYEVGDVIGRGATAEVRQGFDRVLRRTVAIKCFDHRRPSTDVGRQRFELEARLAAGLTHPNIVAVFDLGLSGDTPFLVMECLPGRTLADEIADGPLSVDRVHAVMREVLGALGAAHARGVLHRDIKPSNVLMTSDGHVKLADFGIARSDDTRDLTETGMVVGTPAYLAPERLTGSPATIGSDLYSVGVVAYEALAGVKPFGGDTPVAVAYAVCHSDAASLRTYRDDVSPAVDHVIAATMARKSEDRFASVSEVIDALDAAVERDITLDPDETLPMAVRSVTATQVMPKVAPVPAVSPAPTLPGRGRSTSPSRARRRRALACSALVVAALLLVVGVATRDRSGSPPPTTPTATSAGSGGAQPLPPSLRQPFNDLEHAVEP